VFFLFGGIASGSLPKGYPVHYCFIVVVLAACVSHLVYYGLVRRQAGQVLLPGIPDTDAYDADIRQKVRHMYPFTLFNCLQGQLSVGLISLFGASAQVADLGALSRLIVVFGLAGAPLVQIAIPSFARSRDRRQLLAQFRKVCALYALFATGIMGLAILLPTPILWLLGPQYSHLGNELRFTVLGMVTPPSPGVYSWRAAGCSP
jgi:O-antigen/teichoic acid export membrane protein